jgi:hypothetical protein
MSRRFSQPGRRSAAGMAAIEWILVLLAATAFVAIVLILYSSSQPTQLTPMR